MSLRSPSHERIAATKDSGGLAGGDGELVRRNRNASQPGQCGLYIKARQTFRAADSKL